MFALPSNSSRHAQTLDELTTERLFQRVLLRGLSSMGERLKPVLLDERIIARIQEKSNIFTLVLTLLIAFARLQR